MSTGQSSVTLCGWGIKVEFIPLLDKRACGWQVKLCDPSLTRAIPERFRDEFLVTKRYTNLRLLYFTYFTLHLYIHSLITRNNRAQRLEAEARAVV